MIEHLRGRERALEPLGWTGREAEWIALVCLHSGVFIRPQFCDYFETDRKQALRVVRALVERRAAIEGDSMMFLGGARLCRISSMAIYRALGVENIRHRRKARNSVLMRRLMSLDFVLEHPGLNWLPTEPEKVEFLKGSVFVPACFPAGFTTETMARRNATLRSSSPSPGELIPSPLPTSIQAGRAPANSTHGDPRMFRFGMRSVPRGYGWR